MKNVVHYLKQNAVQFPDRLALAMPDGSSATFAELWDRVDRFSCGVGARGIAPGDRVIVMIPMSLDLYVALLGIIKMGGVAIFVDPWIGTRQIARFCSFAEPRGFVGIPKSHMLRLFEKDLRRLPFTMTTGGCFLGIPARHSLKSLLAQSGDGVVHESAEQDSALITFTTGSSGVPKGANRTHGFLNAQYLALKHEFPYVDTDVDMPMFPVFALSNLGSGIPSIVPDIDFSKVADADGKVLFDQLKRHGCTTSTASPPFFDNLAEYVTTSGEALDLRRILTGGAPVSDAQLRRWKAAFPDTEIQVVYGSTEAEPVAHVDANERLDLEGKGFCAGVPCSLVTSKIIQISDDAVTLGDDGWSELELPAGEIGELIVSGDHICRDYFNNPDAVRANKIVETDGTLWHRMGDTGYVDDAGRFWLVGRVHSTICRDGTMHHPQLIEQAAKGDDDRISRVAALGIEDTTLGQRIVVIVKSDDDAVVAAVRERLEASGQMADDVILWKQPFPMDPRHNSKVDYPALTTQVMDKDER